MSGDWFILEHRTGAITGFMDKKEAVKMIKLREKMYKGSYWALCRCEDDIDKSKLYPIYHDDRLELTLQSLYGDTTHPKKPKKDCGEVINFNFNNTAFDVLVNYAFGGDRQAALEYLKTL